MFEYFSINELFINLIFPLITEIVPLILTYFLFEPIVGLIKKTWQTLTYEIIYQSCLWRRINSSPFLCVISFMYLLEWKVFLISNQQDNLLSYYVLQHIQFQILLNFQYNRRHWLQKFHLPYQFFSCAYLLT